MSRRRIKPGEIRQAQKHQHGDEIRRAMEAADADRRRKHKRVQRRAAERRQERELRGHYNPEGGPPA